MSRRTFDETGYPCESTEVSPQDWFYTQREGLLVCAGGCPNCGRQKNTVVLTWPEVRRAIDDHKRAPARARRAKYGRGAP